MEFSDISRKRAFLIHLSFSMATFAVLLYFIIFEWYPSYYFYIDGGYRAVTTLLTVHLALGPLLTLLVFRPGKLGLKFDISVIVAIQMLALSWGTWWIFTERPALTVFYDGEFICMKQSEVANIDLDRLTREGKSSPLLAVLPRPNTFTEYQFMLEEAVVQRSASIYIFSDRFLPMDIVGTVQLMNYVLDVADSFTGDKGQVDAYKKIWSEYIDGNPDEAGKYMYFPLTCRFDKVLAVFDPEVGEIIDYVPVYTNRAISRIELGVTRKEADHYREGIFEGE